MKKAPKKYPLLLTSHHNPEKLKILKTHYGEPGRYSGIFICTCRNPNINWAMVAIPETAAKVLVDLKAPTAHFVLEVQMYLEQSTTLHEVVSFGVNPLVEFLSLFEENHLDLDHLDPNSQEAILWHEIMGKALRLQEVSRRVAEHDRSRRARQHQKIKNPHEHRLEQTLIDLLDFLVSNPDPANLKAVAANIQNEINR